MAKSMDVEDWLVITFIPAASICCVLVALLLAFRVRQAFNNIREKIFTEQAGATDMMGDAQEAPLRFHENILPIVQSFILRTLCVGLIVTVVTGSVFILFSVELFNKDNDGNGPWRDMWHGGRCIVGLVLGAVFFSIAFAVSMFIAPRSVAVVMIRIGVPTSAEERKSEATSHLSQCSIATSLVYIACTCGLLWSCLMLANSTAEKAFIAIMCSGCIGWSIMSTLTALCGSIVALTLGAIVRIFDDRNRDSSPLTDNKDQNTARQELDAMSGFAFNDVPPETIRGLEQVASYLSDLICSPTLIMSTILELTFVYLVLVTPTLVLPSSLPPMVAPSPASLPPAISPSELYTKLLNEPFDTHAHSNLLLFPVTCCLINGIVASLLTVAFAKSSTLSNLKYRSSIRSLVTLLFSFAVATGLYCGSFARDDIRSSNTVLIKAHKYDILGWIFGGLLLVCVVFFAVSQFTANRSLTERLTRFCVHGIGVIYMMLDGFSHVAVYLCNILIVIATHSAYNLHQDDNELIVAGWLALGVGAVIPVPLMLGNSIPGPLLIAIKQSCAKHGVRTDADVLWSLDDEHHHAAMSSRVYATGANLVLAFPTLAALFVIAQVQLSPTPFLSALPFLLIGGGTARFAGSIISLAMYRSADRVSDRIKFLRRKHLAHTSVDQASQVVEDKTELLSDSDHFGFSGRAAGHYSAFNNYSGNTQDRGPEAIPADDLVLTALTPTFVWASCIVVLIGTTVSVIFAVCGFAPAASFTVGSILTGCSSAFTFAGSDAMASSIVADLSRSDHLSPIAEDEGAKQTAGNTVSVQTPQRVIHGPLALATTKLGILAVIFIALGS